MIINNIKILKILNLKSIHLLGIATFFYFQLFILFNLEIYPEKYTIIEWYNSQYGIFETLGMRIGEDNTFKATYSFIYLLPVYMIFCFFKLLFVPDLIALGSSNFIVINLQLYLLIKIIKKMNYRVDRSIILYIIFFIGTFMWTGIQRIFPHDTFILLLLLKIIFSRMKFLLSTFMVYVEPVMGTFFIIFDNFLNSFSFNNKKLFDKSFIFSFFPIVLGLTLWQLPILYLENNMNIVADNSSIMKRIFGHEDPYFFSRLQLLTPFHYYLPSYIQSSFASFKFGALIFAASNIISPFSIYLIWKYRFFYKEIFNNSNQLFLNGLSLVLSYTLFALIFAQAAASHRFDYDQFFQFGLLLMLIPLFSKKDIIHSKQFIIIILYHFLFVLPFLILHFTILR